MKSNKPDDGYHIDPKGDYQIGQGKGAAPSDWKQQEDNEQAYKYWHDNWKGDSQTWWQTKAQATPAAEAAADNEEHCTRKGMGERRKKESGNTGGNNKNEPARKEAAAAAATGIRAKARKKERAIKEG